MSFHSLQQLSTQTYKVYIGFSLFEVVKPQEAFVWIACSDQNQGEFTDGHDSVGAR